MYTYRVKFRCVSSSVSNVKALVGTFNQEKALVVAISVIVKSFLTFVCSSTGTEKLSLTSNWQLPQPRLSLCSLCLSVSVSAEEVSDI